MWLCLVDDDVIEAQAAGQDDHADHREQHGHLVGDELGGGPHAADEGVLVVGCPPAQQNGEGHDAEDGEGQQQAADRNRKQRIRGCRVWSRTGTGRSR